MTFYRFLTITFVFGGWCQTVVLSFHVRQHQPKGIYRHPYIARKRLRSTIWTATPDQNQDEINTTHISGTFSSSSASSSTSASSPGISSHLPKLIVTCGTSDELIHAIDEYVQSHHVVAEIGSQLRQVSKRLCEKCHSATLVDVQRKFPKLQSHRTEAMRLVESSSSSSSTSSSSSFFRKNQRFMKLDSSLIGPKFCFSNNNNNNTNHGYDVLVLDVNAIVGNDLEWTSLQIIQQFHSMNSLCRNNNNNNNQNCKPQENDLIVLVKSSGLNHWANRIHSVHYWNDHHHELLSVESGTTNSISSSFIVATVGVQEYRSTVPTTVRSTDCVLEVGCHHGTTTALLQQHAAHCIGVDVGPKIIAQAKQRFPNVHFRVGNAWKTGELLRFLQDYQHQQLTTMTSPVEEKEEKEQQP